MFERFSDKGMHVLMVAQKEARRVGAKRIGTEQLLLGLAQETTSTVSYLLETAGFNLPRYRAQLHKFIHTESTPESELLGTLRALLKMFVPMPLSQNTYRLIEIAIEEADQAQSGKVKPEHLLAALQKCENCAAMQLLCLSGVQPETLQGRIAAAMTLS
jgi:ATP-dependent Clp protease ATP-binding subunit ClpA